MTEKERQLWENRIRLAAAERLYQQACQIPAVPFRELEAMLSRIGQMRTEVEAQAGGRCGAPERE